MQTKNSPVREVFSGWRYIGYHLSVTELLMNIDK